MAKKNKAEGNVYTELESIKKLLMLKLLVDGVSHAQIAAALGVDQGNLSRVFPAKLAKAKKKG